MKGRLRWWSNRSMQHRVYVSITLFPQLPTSRITQKRKLPIIKICLGCSIFFKLTWLHLFHVPCYHFGTYYSVCTVGTNSSSWLHSIAHSELSKYWATQQSGTRNGHFIVSKALHSRSDFNAELYSGDTSADMQDWAMIQPALTFVAFEVLTVTIMNSTVTWLIDYIQGLDC